MLELKKTEVNSLLIKKRRNLTNAQKHLYLLISEKITTSAQLFYEEVKNIYISFACQCVKDGIPHYWRTYDHKDDNGIWHGKLVPLTNEMLQSTVILWLTHNIGILVLKGYLKVLPAISFDNNSLTLT